MRTLLHCLVAVTCGFAPPFSAAADTPAARASTPPDNPAPQPQSTVPPAATTTADDEQCRLATRESAGAASCISSSDADHDGVSDGQDQCPDTTPGVAVDETGCARSDP
jgi:hypothetical protein